MTGGSIPLEEPATERAFLRLDFAVLALPRSGTAWLANWLTTDRSICWHDPAAHSTPFEMDCRPSSAEYRGISCTASWMWENWVPPDRTVIIDRPIDEIQASLRRLGMPQMPEEAVWRFKMIDGWRIPYRALFSDQAESIWAALLPEIKFNKERHDALVKMNVQSNFNYVPDTTQMQRVIQELSDGIRS